MDEAPSSWLIGAKPMLAGGCQAGKE